MAFAILSLDDRWLVLHQFQQRRGQEKASLVGGRILRIRRQEAAQHACRATYQVDAIDLSLPQSLERPVNSFRLNL